MLKIFIFLNAQKEQGEPQALGVSFFFPWLLPSVHFWSMQSNVCGLAVSLLSLLLLGLLLLAFLWLLASPAA